MVHLIYFHSGFFKTSPTWGMYNLYDIMVRVALYYVCIYMVQLYIINPMYLVLM